MGGQYIDHTSGLELGAGMAKAMRLEEMEFMRKIELLEEVDVSECYEVTGKALVTTKWVDLNKGTMDKADGRLLGATLSRRERKTARNGLLRRPHSSARNSVQEGDSER